MAIEFQCPQCAVAIRVPDAAAGKKGTCPNSECGVKLRVPVPEIPESPAAPIPEQPVAETPAAPFPTFDPTKINIPPAQSGPILPPEITAPPDVSASVADPAGLGIPVPPVAIQPTVALRNKRRARRKRSGAWFPVLCGLALVGGVAWMFGGKGPEITGDRAAYAVSGSELQPKLVPRSLIDVKPIVLQTVLEHFENEPERMRGNLMVVEFAAEREGLHVNLLTASSTRIFQFPIDLGLRTWYESHREELVAVRDKQFQNSLKLFFAEWDVRIRNREADVPPEDFRMTVGRTACVSGLGYCVSARVGKELYPCVYEDEGNLYFILLAATTSFEVVAFYANGKESPFEGGYKVTVKDK